MIISYGLLVGGLAGLSLFDFLPFGSTGLKC